MANPAIEYAENKLNVHSVYDSAIASHTEMDELVTELDKAQDLKRVLTDRIADREADLLIEEQGKHASMSATALKEHMKVVVRRDELLQKLRTEFNKTSSEVAGLEYDLDVLKTRVKIECARMEQLGGYFNFLAAAKQAETQKKLITQETK